MDSTTKMKLIAYPEKGKVVIKVSLPGAEMTMKYTDAEAVEAIVYNLPDVFEYMINEYMSREDFQNKIDEAIFRHIGNIKKDN